MLRIFQELEHLRWLLLCLLERAEEESVEQVKEFSNESFDAI